MNISKKWRAAAAGAIAVALVGTGALSANAAEGDILNPQSNGSLGSFYIWDGNTAEFADGDPTRSYARNAGLIIAGSATDVLAEIPVPAQAAGFNEVYRFVAKSTELSGGTNTWRAYSTTAATGPNGGLLTDDFQLDSKLFGNNGGIDTVFTEGGDWYVGVAFTTNNGVTPLASIYRTIHVNAATDTWTVDAVQVETGPVATAPAVTSHPTSDPNVTVGAVKTLTAAASGTPTPTVQWESLTDGTAWANVPGATSATLTVPTATAGTTHFRAVFTNSAGSATTNAAQVTVTAAIAEPTSPASDATKKPITAVDGIVTLTGVNAGTYTAYAWPNQANLGTVVVPASGIATINVPAARQDGTAQTFALLQADNTVAAWGNVVVAAPEFPLTGSTQLTADVTVSGKFALEGVNAGPVALGTAKRGATTAPVALGAFTVTDDRDDLKGWTLNASVGAFTGPAGTEPIPGSALGLAAKKVGGDVDGITVRATPKVAGDEWVSTLVAEGAALSNTVEAGTQFDADLTFKAPAKAKKGTYASTLTLTLASK